MRLLSCKGTLITEHSVDQVDCSAVTFSELTYSIADDLLIDTTRLRTDAIGLIDPLKVSDVTNLHLIGFTFAVSITAMNGRQVGAADKKAGL